MHRLDLSVSDCALNLAIDEALLESAESQADKLVDSEVLRLWSFDRPVVVVGRATKVEQEVNQAYCKQHAIPILRRCSGGTSVTVGPGCLLFSLILNTEVRTELQDLDRVHRFVMGTIGRAISGVWEPVEFQGTCDLTWHNRKFSGNSLRVARRHVLYHGTILFDFPLDLLQAALRVPPRQPEYREGREHRDFVVNVPLSEAQLRTTLAEAFDAKAVLLKWPEAYSRQLVESRYGRPEWNFRH